MECCRQMLLRLAAPSGTLPNSVSETWPSLRVWESQGSEDPQPLLCTPEAIYSRSKYSCSKILSITRIDAVQMFALSSAIFCSCGRNRRLRSPKGHTRLLYTPATLAYYP